MEHQKYNEENRIAARKKEVLEFQVASAKCHGWSDDDIDLVRLILFGGLLPFGAAWIAYMRFFKALITPSLKYDD